MTEAVVPPLEPPRRFHFPWISGVLLRPRQTFQVIADQMGAVWLTPMLVLTLTTLTRVLVAGWLRQAAAASGNIPLPPDFQWYSPEQQAQFMQAMQAMQGPVFTFVFPILTTLFGVWIGWLIVGGLLHLVLTLLGGRGDTGHAMNIVAWASLPFAVRDLVRVASMLSTRQLIQNPGLAGFAPASVEGPSTLNMFLISLLSLIDLYLVWHILLLILGVRASNGLALSKSIGGVLIVILLVLLLEAGLGLLGMRFGNLTLIKPFT